MKKSLLFLCALALCSVSLFSQTKNRVTSPTHTYQTHAPMAAAPASLKLIFSNLGPKKSAFVGSAYFLNGPLSVSGQQFIGMAFTSKVNATVTQVQAAAQYNATGANQVNFSLYSDNAGAPGTLLAGPVTVTNLPSYFTCCTLAVANFATGIPITAGTQYWVVGDTPATGLGSDFEGVWSFVPASKLRGGANQSGTWFGFQASIQEPAGAVYGTIP